MCIPFKNIVEQLSEQEFQTCCINFSIYSSLLVQWSPINQRRDKRMTKNFQSARTYLDFTVKNTKLVNIRIKEKSKQTMVSTHA
jgi:hypothetical protein